MGTYLTPCVSPPGFLTAAFGPIKAVAKIGASVLTLSVFKIGGTVNVMVALHIKMIKEGVHV